MITNFDITVDRVKRKAKVLTISADFSGRFNEEAWEDNALSEELYKTLNQERSEYIQISEGYFVEGSDINWQEKIDEDYERILNK